MAEIANPIVEMETSMGNLEIELWADKAPASAENFLKYVDAGHYDGLIFHRVIKDFMVQGGGFSEDMQQRGCLPPIKNEAANGCKNTRGTLAMARTGVVDSATAQFFINTVDNAFLNHKSTKSDEFGYCVFGQVTSGMDIVDNIRGVATGNKDGHQDVPLVAITIKSAKRKQ